MSLPLFTAEASLCKTRQTYRGYSSFGPDTGSIVAASVPAHPHSDSPSCKACLDLGGLAYAGCLGQAVVTAGYCGPFLYFLCLAGEVAGCVTAYLTYAGTVCHAFGIPSWLGGTLGPPCCPVVCSAGCCNSGETCAGLDPTTAQNLCCSPGLTVCGQNCCDASERCMPDGSCCPTANLCGHEDCCTPDETCMPQDYCCPNDQVCGQTCCSSGDTCMPDGSCCPAGHKVCSGNCCPDPNDVCDPTTNTCTQTCPDGTPTCGGNCCAAGEVCCNGTCCGADQLCCNVQTPQGFQLQCYTPGPKRDGLVWCGQGGLNVNEISCSNCAPGQQCLPVYSHGLQSSDWYCQ